MKDNKALVYMTAEQWDTLCSIVKTTTDKNTGDKLTSLMLDLLGASELFAKWKELQD